MIKTDLKDILELNIKFSKVEIFTNDNNHFNAIIISELFKEKSILERQKMVYEVIGKYISNGEIHAISFKTYTPDELNN